MGKVARRSGANVIGVGAEVIGLRFLIKPRRGAFTDIITVVGLEK